MKNQNVLSKDFQEAISSAPLSGSNEVGFISKTSKHIKKILFIGSLAGIGLFLNSCRVGYVATEPTYSEYSRPARTSGLDVWIDGDWVFNQSSHVYVQKRGYWEKPRQNRIYIKGFWQSTSRGKHWKKGHWEKKGRQEKRHNR
ncbi:MAG: hypothetical protein JJE49_05405 [Peptostreptococcaceae bacterium]|nr:hypothetical protein [Peptostreptococcaceae bacterium]